MGKFPHIGADKHAQHLKLYNCTQSTKLTWRQTLQIHTFWVPPLRFGFYLIVITYTTTPKTLGLSYEIHFEQNLTQFIPLEMVRVFFPDIHLARFDLCENRAFCVLPV